MNKIISSIYLFIFMSILSSVALAQLPPNEIAYSAYISEKLNEHTTYKVWKLDRSSQNKVDHIAAKEVYGDLEDLAKLYSEEPLSEIRTERIRAQRTRASLELSAIMEKLRAKAGLVVPVREGDYINFYKVSPESLDLGLTDDQKSKSISEGILLGSPAKEQSYLTIDQIQRSSEKNTEFYVSSRRFTDVVALVEYKNLTEKELECQKTQGEELKLALEMNFKLRKIVGTKELKVRLEIERSETQSLKANRLGVPHKRLEIRDDYVEAVAVYFRSSETCYLIQAERFRELIN